LGIGALATLATVGGLTFWLTHRSVPAGESTDEVPASVPTTQQTKSTPASRRDAEAEARLLQSLSPGYAPGVCEPVEPEPGASAMVNCGTNTDPGGPTSATYTLALDKPALDRVLADAVTADSVLICPGNIQSPGPWRRNATPDKISGTLVCGLQRNVPAIAWSDEERMLVAAIRSDPPGPSLDQLFAWWSTHS
jgi:hypothetical protein